MYPEVPKGIWHQLWLRSRRYQGGRYRVRSGYLTRSSDGGFVVPGTPRIVVPAPARAPPASCTSVPLSGSPTVSGTCVNQVGISCLRTSFDLFQRARAHSVDRSSKPLCSNPLASHIVISRTMMWRQMICLYAPPTLACCVVVFVRNMVWLEVPRSSAAPPAFLDRSCRMSHGSQPHWLSRYAVRSAFTGQAAQVRRHHLHIL